MLTGGHFKKHCATIGKGSTLQHKNSTAKDNTTSIVIWVARPQWSNGSAALPHNVLRVLIDGPETYVHGTTGFRLSPLRLCHQCCSHRTTAVQLLLLPVLPLLLSVLSYRSRAAAGGAVGDAPSSAMVCSRQAAATAMLLLPCCSCCGTGFGNRTGKR